MAFLACLASSAMGDEWKITIWTTDIKYAGCDCNIDVQLFGTKGQSKRVYLDNSYNNYGRGNVDEFRFTETVGILQRIIISNDEKGPGGAWHCSKIKLRNLSSGKEFTWYPNTWLWTGSRYGEHFANRIMLPVGRKNAGPCRSGWTKSPVNQQCFRLMEKPYYLSYAAYICGYLGARLAHIHNSEENWWLNKFVNKKRILIGLNDVKQEGNYLWEGSGNRVRYTNWATGEPNHVYKYDDAVEMYENGQWHDMYYKTYLPYVCQMEPLY